MRRMVSIRSAASPLDLSRRASLLPAWATGVNALIDAEANQASSRLQALQTHEQLAIQSLSIANQNARLILMLFP